MSLLLGSNNNKIIDLIHKGGASYGESLIPLTTSSDNRSLLIEEAKPLIRFRRTKRRISRRKSKKTTRKSRKLRRKSKKTRKTRRVRKQRR